MLKRIGTLTALAALSLLAVGCATGGSAPPASTPGPSAGSEPPAAQEYPLEAAWLDEGRALALLTWGSSSCVPVVDSVTAQGQQISVVFAETDAHAACTDDYVARASLITLPEGVDPTEDIEVVLEDPAAGGVTARIELDGEDALAGRPGDPTAFEPSAGWYDDREIVLLTWGSSSCPPIIESIDETAAAAEVTFVTDDRACTMDRAPRLTLLTLNEEHDDDDFVLTLQGGGFESVTVQPIGD